MSRRKILRLSLKGGAILFAAFVLIESLMIVTDPILFKGLFEYDPDLGFRVGSYYPNSIGRRGGGSDGTLTNRFGFNDRDYSLEKAPGTLRILVAGDSFGWEGGLEGNYTAQLEQLFERRDGEHRVDVVNTGYPGTHTGEQLAMLKKFGLQYNPDLVVLGFFAGNDFFDADRNRKRIILNKYFYDITKQREFRLFGYPMVAGPRTWLFLKNTYQSRAASRLARSEAESWARANGQPVPRIDLPEQAFYRVKRALLEFFNRKTSAVKFADNINYIFESIAAMNELLKSRNIKLVVAIFPDEFQVNQTLFSSLVERFHLTKDDYDLDLAQNLLKPFLDSKGIPYVDLLDRFRAEAQQRQLYLFRGTHWNPSGNELAAQILFQYLDEQTRATSSR